jgi:hypothetical protein
MEIADSLTFHAAEEPSPFAGLEETQARLRLAVEGREYGRALSLMEEQRGFFERAGKTHPETKNRARDSHGLCVWALTLIRLQREQLHRNIEELAAQKRVISCYAAAVPFAL